MSVWARRCRGFTQRFAGSCRQLRRSAGNHTGSQVAPRRAARTEEKETPSLGYSTPTPTTLQECQTCWEGTGKSGTHPDEEGTLDQIQKSDQDDLGIAALLEPYVIGQINYLLRHCDTGGISMVEVAFAECSVHVSSPDTQNNPESIATPCNYGQH